MQARGFEGEFRHLRARALASLRARLAVPPPRPVRRSTRSSPSCGCHASDHRPARARARPRGRAAPRPPPCARALRAGRAAGGRRAGPWHRRPGARPLPLPGRVRGAARRGPAHRCGREGRAGGTERRRQEHADAPAQRDAAAGARVGAGRGPRGRQGHDPPRPRRGGPRLPGPRRPAVQPHGVRRRRLRAAPHGPAGRRGAPPGGAGPGGGGHGRVRPPCPAPDVAGPAQARRPGHRAVDGPVDPRVRRAVRGPGPARAPRAHRPAPLAGPDDAGLDARHAAGRRGLPADRRDGRRAGGRRRTDRRRSWPTRRSSRRTGSRPRRPGRGDSRSPAGERSAHAVDRRHLERDEAIRAPEQPRDERRAPTSAGSRAGSRRRCPVAASRIWRPATAAVSSQPSDRHAHDEGERREREERAAQRLGEARRVLVLGLRGAETERRPDERPGAARQEQAGAEGGRDEQVETDERDEPRQAEQERDRQDQRRTRRRRSAGRGDR